MSSRVCMVSLLVLLPGCQGVGLPGPDAGADGHTARDASPDASPDARWDDGATPPDGAPPACVDVPAEGRCDGDRRVSCDGAGDRQEEDCAALGGTCLAGDGLAPRCGPVPAGCEDLVAGDLCAGNRLALCHGDRLELVSCAALGGRCGRSGERAGCLPGAPGPFLAEGVVTRDHREARPEGLGEPVTVPAVGVPVVVLRAGDRVPLGLGVTDGVGRFAIAYDPGSAPAGVILRVITLGVDPAHRLWVTDGQDATYGVESPPVPDGSGTAQASLHISEAAGAGAFHIFETLRGLQDAARAQVAADLPLVQVAWEAGQVLACGTCFSRYPPTIFVLGEASDTDEFDPDVLAHEFGHYLAFAASRDDSPGGAHDGSPTDPRRAWSEGLATWVGLQLRGRDVYVDTVATGATVRDPEDLGVDADPLGGIAQLLSEFVVLEILWDLTDPATGPLDPVAWPVADVFSVLTGYLPSGGLVDRGGPEVDLVEFLDGWLCGGHGDVAGLTAVVVDGQGFPYDFGGPGAPCPKPGVPWSVALHLAGDPRAAGLTVRLRARATHPLPAATAHLRVPVAPGVFFERRRELGALGPEAAVEVTWTLPVGLDPPWVAAGLAAEQGPRSAGHRAVKRLRRPLPAARVRRVGLGGLLRLRVVVVGATGG